MPRKKIVRPPFDEAFKEIEGVVEGFRYKWSLDSIAWVSFDDIKMSIINHIYKKWKSYDPKLPLAPWVARITRNQMINNSRDLYVNYRSPCVDCPLSENIPNHCRVYETQDPEKCSILAKWHKSKKNKHDIHMPLALEFHSQEVYNSPHTDLDFDAALIQLNDKIKDKLTKFEYRVYRLLYIKNKPREEAAKIIGFKSTEKNRQMGYRRILQIEKIIYERAKELIYGGEIDF